MTNKHLYWEQRRIARDMWRRNILNLAKDMNVQECKNVMLLDYVVPESQIPYSWMTDHYVYIQRRTKQRNLSRIKILDKLKPKIYTPNYSDCEKVSDQEKIEIINSMLLLSSS